MDNSSPLPRRRFIKMLSFGTATAMVGGKLWQREVLAFCENLPGQSDAIVKIRLSDYPPLLQDYGSVRLGINPLFNGNSFPDGNFYPFIINRDGFGNFYVLDSECRHASCVVPTYSDIEFLIRCQCHGSEYAIDGAVLNGPATQPLHQYPCEFDGDDTLTIHVPCWGFAVNLAVQPGGATSRVKLDFQSFTNVTYEVTYKEKIGDPWAPALFATTANGPANQATLLGDGLPATVYVERATQAGFYAVGMKLFEV